MKRYEKESLLKNFLVFFSLLLILLLLLFTELYRTKINEYKQTLYKTMHVCNYTMECPQFDYDFVPKDPNKLNELFEQNGLQSYFSIPKSNKYYLKISYNQTKYHGDISAIQNTLLIKFILATLLLLILSLFFTLYSLNPIRKALKINDEFIKDILHDFNTPITSMILNLKMFQEEYGENIFVVRITQGLNNITLLQNNLKAFLYHSPSQNTMVDIAKLAKNQLKLIENGYPKLTFEYIKKNDLLVFSNQDILIRILDNILSNACKYNKPHGKVFVFIEKNAIIIKDTGKGIKDVKKVLQRYYKEQDRGIGLGLHIVQKLINELEIDMKIESKVNVGSSFTLRFPSAKKGSK